MSADPAILLVARHGKADYVESWFSDEGGWLSAEGRRQAGDLAEAVRGRGITRVWTSDISRAVQTAEVVAARLALGDPCPVITRKVLREVDAGDLVGQTFDVARLHEVTDRWFAGELDARFPGGESGTEVVARYSAALAEVAAEHPGGTVLVVGHQTAAAITLHELARRAGDPVPERQLENGEFAEVAIP